jgi:hypothetical protein
VTTLDEWTASLTAELGVDVSLDAPALLDLARRAAHEVDRPAAPLTTFLVGYAAGQRAATAGVTATDATREAITTTEALLDRRTG